MNLAVPSTERAERLRTALDLFMVYALRYDTDAMLRLLKREDLSMPRIGALGVVERSGVASISEISVCLGLSLGNTSLLIDKLVCSGLVTRAEDEQDRRHKLIRLTPTGEACLHEFRATRIQSLIESMLLLSPDLIDRTIAILEEVTAQLPQRGPEHRLTPIPLASPN